MKIKDFQRPRQENYKELPQEFWDAMQPVFTQVYDLSQAVRGRLTVADNLAAEFRDLIMAQDDEVVIETRVVQGPVIGAVALKSDAPGLTLSVRIIDLTHLGVTGSWDPAVTVPTLTRVLIFGS